MKRIIKFVRFFICFIPELLLTLQKGITKDLINTVRMAKLMGKLKFDAFSPTEEEEESNLPKKSQTHRRNTECLIRETKTIYRRAFSETQLLDILGKEFQNGYSYHCITAGDVDSLSYLKCILRQQDLDYCLAYLGEIFPNTYKHEWNKLKQIFEKYNCGRIAVFKNHSKIYAGYGNKFHFGIETSANINTNPRTENGCITIGKDIFDFYKQYFDGIISFEK